MLHRPTVSDCRSESAAPSPAAPTVPATARGMAPRRIDEAPALIASAGVVGVRLRSSARERAGDGGGDCHVQQRIPVLELSESRRSVHRWLMDSHGALRQSCERGRRSDAPLAWLRQRWGAPRRLSERAQSSSRWAVAEVCVHLTNVAMALAAQEIVLDSCIER
jgi:hypothetical protein